MQKITVLGNCVGERMLLLLQAWPGFSERYTVERFRILPHIDERYFAKVAERARQCDVIFTQPLFRYGPCNTEALRRDLRRGQKLIVFSSPLFPAYFPDVCHLSGMEDLKSPKVLEWDSSIIFSCYAQGVPVSAVADIYTSHWLFQKEHVKNQIYASLENYCLREEGVDLSTLLYCVRQWRATKLFHSPRHPADCLLEVMGQLMGHALGLPQGASMPAELTFSATQWPVITRNHTYFSFPEQAYFVVDGGRRSIEDMAREYYALYAAYPQVVAANRHALVAV